MPPRRHDRVPPAPGGSSGGTRLDRYEGGLRRADDRETEVAFLSACSVLPRRHQNPRRPGGDLPSTSSADEPTQIDTVEPDAQSTTGRMELSVEDISPLTETLVEIESIAQRMSIERGDVRWAIEALATHHIPERLAVVLHPRWFWLLSDN